MIERITGEGRKRNLSGPLLQIKRILSLATALYLLASVVLYPEPILHRGICFGLFFALAFLSYSTPGSKRGDKVPVWDLVFALMSLSVSLYIWLNLDRLINRVFYVDQVFALDIVFGAMTIFLLIEGTRRIIGPWLSVLGLLSIFYAKYGYLIPGRFGHRGFSTEKITDSLFLTSNGIWGSTMGIATSHIMVFMIFGAMLLESGAGSFLFDFVTSLTGKTRGGVAKTAIVTSALFGMISGSAIANASTTGVMTIPMMKKKGYPPLYAASLESCASVGGCFMPPIMGSVAFMMSEVVGIPYFKIAIAAFLPAVVYFTALFFTVDIMSRKLGMKGDSFGRKTTVREIFTRGLTFFVPLLYLIFRLASGFSPSRVGLESIGVLIVTSLATQERITVKKAAKGLVKGTEKGIMIVTTMATCGILIGIINATGIAAKFSSVLISLAGVSTASTLVLVMLLAVFLGLAMNITSSYLLTAVICAPILIRMGHPPISVHMFILFFSAMATITPPVALTSFAAASIAGAPPMETGFKSMKTGIAAYILPFIFIYNPAILLVGAWYETALAFILSVTGVALVALGMENWWFDRKTDIVFRLAVIGSGIMVITGSPTLLASSAAIILMIFLNYRNKERVRVRAAVDSEKK